MIIVRSKQPVTIEKGIMAQVYFLFVKNSLILRPEKDENGVVIPFVTIDFVELIKNSNNEFVLYRTNRIRYKLTTFNAVTASFDYTNGCFAWMEDDDTIADVVMGQIAFTTSRTTPPATIDDLDIIWYYGLTMNDLEKVTINETVSY